MVNQHMKISQKGIALIKEFEGLRLTAYQDAVGVWTIGYGHTKDVYAGMTITEQQAIAYLNDDIMSHAAGIFKYVKVALNQNQFDALVSFHFNLGANILQGSQLLTYLNNRQWQQAATEMKLYNRAGGRVLQGLVRRRQAEVDLFLATSTSASTAQSTTDNATYYTVVAGDSLWRISQKYQLTVDELVRLNGFASSNVVIHPGQRLVVSKGKEATPTQPSAPAPTTSSQIEKMIQWMKSHEGKVTYSQTYRMGPNSYDCSSAVFKALIHAGFLPVGTWLGTTESLFALENTLLMPIDYSQVQRGDIFVNGVKGYSLGDNGHTGIFLDKNTIIHCTSVANGIITTPFSGWRGSGPFSCYRLKGVTTVNATPQPSTPAQPISTTTERVQRHYAESGKFTANQSVAIRNEPNNGAPSVATLDNGESVTYDSVYITNQFVYISYISYSGVRRYVAVRTNKNGTKGALWGTIV